MTAKEYLSQLRFRHARVNSLRERIARYRDLATRCTPAYGGMPGGGGGNGSKTEEAVLKIAQLSTEMQERIDEIAELTVEIEAVIDAVPDVRYREILRMRHLNEWSWLRIATELQLSEDWVKHAHGYALLQVTVPEYAKKIVA